MIRATTNIKISSNFKEKTIKMINDTIEDTLIKSQVCLDQTKKNKIKNLSLDQINIDVAHRNKLKAMWVFDTEDYIPVLILIDKKLSKEYIKDNPDDKVYKMETNGDWKAISDVVDGMNRSEFENTVKSMLLEDFGTAAFYGTLSYISEGVYEEKSNDQNRSDK